MSRLIAALVLASVLVSMGCQAGGARRTGLLLDAVDAQDLGYALGWASTADVRKPRRIVNVGIVGDLIVVIEEPGNMVKALSLSDGSLRWATVVGTASELLFGPRGVDSQVIVNTETQLYRLSAETGDVLGISKLDHPVTHAPVVTDRVAVFGGVNGRVFAHDFYAGFALWQYDLTANVKAAPVREGNSIVAADSAGVYALLNIETGVAAWRGRTFGAVTATPTVNRFAVLIPSQDGSLYAINRTTGRDQWVYRSDAPIMVSPVAIDNRVFLFTPGTGTVALDATSGKELWTRADGARPIRIDGTRILMSSGKRLIYADADTGKTIDERQTLPLRTALEGPDGSLILVSPDGKMQRLNRR